MCDVCKAQIFAILLYGKDFKHSLRGKAAESYIMFDTRQIIQFTNAN